MNITSLFRTSVCAAVLSFAGLASAATSYVIPWYVNPSLKARAYLGADAFAPQDLSLGADDDLLVFSAASGLTDDIQGLSLTALASGTVTNRDSKISSSAIGLTSAPFVAANDAKGLYFAFDPANQKGVAVKSSHRRWIGLNAPQAVSFDSEVTATSFAFDAAGDRLWTNAETPGRIVGWTLSGSTFSASATYESGLSLIKDVCVYTVNGTEYVVVGEGDGTAATKGQVKLVKTADGAVSTLLADATHLNAGIVAVRMSHGDFFRPRLYVLLETGDIAVYYIDRDNLAKVTWSKTLANADLLQAAGAPFGGEAAKIASFAVTHDGGTAVVAYRRNAGDESEATGPMTLAVLKHVPRKWVIYELNDAGNPYKGVNRCLSDGVWNLMFTWDNSGGIYLGSNDKIGGAWLEPIPAEYLDFSKGVAHKASDDSAHEIRWNQQRAFQTNSVSGWKGPRVLYHTPNMTDFSDKCKGWGGEGNFEEIIIDAGKLTKMSSWSGPDKNSKFIIYNFKNVVNMPTWMIYPNNNNRMGGEGRWEDQDMSSAQMLGYRTWMYMDAKGVLSVPAAVSISNECFYGCKGMTEARLGDRGNSLKELWDKAFSGCPELRRVTLGGADGFTIRNSTVFTSCPLEEVTFTGAVPAFASGITVAWPDAAEKTMTFAVPRGDAAWEAILADPTKVKNRLSLAEQQAYRLANPGKYVPFGVVDKSVLKTKYDQYVAYNDMKGGATFTIERDTFFDDEIEISSDWAPAADGTYLPGTKVTLKAKPNATGSFVKWYGDVDPAVATNDEITVTANGSLWLYCRIVHPWTLAADKKTASNGNFTVNCTVVNSDSRTLQLGSGGRFGLYAEADAGSGVCDLGGSVWLAGDDKPWRFLQFSATGGLLCSRNNGKGDADVLLTPRTVVSAFGGTQILHTGSDANAKSLRTLIMDEPEMSSTWGGWMTCGNGNLTRLVLQMPKMTTFSGDGGLWQIPLSDTKFDWWDLSGVTRIDSRALGGLDWDSYAPAKGNLALPSLREVKISNATLAASEQSPLSRLQYVESISLGGKDRRTTVTNICNYAFQTDKALRRLVIHNDASLTVGVNPLAGNARIPDEIVFTGKVPTSDVFANLLMDVTAAATKPVKVYASANMGWDTFAYMDAPTDAERAEAPGETVLGVYRGDAAAPNGKALVIHRESPFDPRGLLIFVR